MSQLYNDMLTTSRASFRTFIKTYAISPPSDPGFTADVPLTMLHAGGVKVARPKIATTAATDPRFAGSATTSIEMRKISKTNAKVYVDLNPYPLQTAITAQRGAEGGNTIYLDMSQAAVANHVPVWFLPWLGGSAIRLTIPSGAAGAHSNIFFTAAINGCSIFIQGTPANPTIFHCGGGTGFSPIQLDEGAVFWQAVMDEFIASDLAENKNKGALHGTSVDKREYVSQPGHTAAVPHPHIAGAVTYMKSTARADALKTELRKKHKFGRLGIEEVNPWGCVMGRRDGAGNWKFYLQENATIVYHQLYRNPIKNIMQAYKTGTVAMPLKYREIFPGGSHHDTIRTPLPKLI
jgi:hypothetical protein